MQESEKNYLECGNFPDPSGEFQERVETESGDGQPPSPSSEMHLWDPRDSDCLPSVFLAVGLALMFILVSWLFLPYDQGSHGLLHNCRALRANESCPLVTRLRSLRLLFPNQPETTWRILQQHVSSQLHRRHSDGTWILAAVGRGDVSDTLLCFLKAILLLLTEERAIEVRFPEQSSAWLPWIMGFLENGTSAVTTTEIYMGQSRVPYGVMVSLWSLTSGNQLGTKISLALALNVTEQFREEFLLQGLTRATVSNILSAVCFASSRMPDKLITTRRNVPLLLVRPEWYLEGGFFC